MIINEPKNNFDSIKNQLKIICLERIGWETLALELKL